MKKIAYVTAAFLLLVLAYGVWPFVGLKHLADAVAARDTTALSELIDLPALKRSLVLQVARRYVELSGKAHNQFEIGVAMQVASTLALAPVEAMLTPEALLQLLSEGGTGTLAQVGISPPRLEAPNIGNLLRFVRNTEYSGRDFYILLPFASDEKTGYRLHLRVENWTWKLVGLRLPEAVQTNLARKIQAGSG